MQGPGKNQGIRRHSGILRVNVSPNGPTQGEIAALLPVTDFRSVNPLSPLRAQGADKVYSWKLAWKGKHEDTNLPNAVQEFSAHPAI